MGIKYGAIVYPDPVPVPYEPPSPGFAVRVERTICGGLSTRFRRGRSAVVVQTRKKTKLSVLKFIAT